MDELSIQQKKLFDDIKHIDEYGNEYWLARELQEILQYTQWRNFQKVISTAQIACKISQQCVADHFAEVSKMITLATGAQRKVIDYRLTRYACYLIVMNGDPRKEVIALGQTYFAVKTRQQELAELYDRLSEEEKRAGGHEGQLLQGRGQRGQNRRRAGKAPDHPDERRRHHGPDVSEESGIL